MIYFIFALIIIYITCLLHKFLKTWWRNRTRDRILENLEDITEHEKQKKK